MATKSSNRVDAVAALLVFVCGAGSWIAIPLVSGHSEPWDSGTGIVIYLTSFIVSGLLSGVFSKRFWLLFISGWIGQVIAIWFAGSGDQRSWILLGFVTTGIGALCLLPGWLAGRLIARNSTVSPLVDTNR